MRLYRPRLGRSSFTVNKNNVCWHSHYMDLWTFVSGKSRLLHQAPFRIDSTVQSNKMITGYIDPEYRDPQPGIPTFPEILEQWLASEPRLKHFRLQRHSYLWIMCKCRESCEFRVMSNGVKIYKLIHNKYDPLWLVSEPNFFDKLKNELLKSCKMKK